MDAKARYAALVLMLAASTPAYTQSVGDLSDIQAETLVLRAKAARAEAQGKLRDMGPASAVAQASGDEGLPVVRGVYGTSGKLYATFLYANGSTVDAVTGSRIPGDFTVRTLTDTRVELVRHGRTHVIGFSDLRPLAPAKTIEPPAASSIPPLGAGQQTAPR